MMRLAKFISLLGHPLFMPAYAFGLLIYTNPYINVMVPDASKRFTFGILIIFTILLPILTAVVFKLLGLIDSLFMKTAEERRWPFSSHSDLVLYGFNLLTKFMSHKVFYYS